MNNCGKNADQPQNQSEKRGQVSHARVKLLVSRKRLNVASWIASTRGHVNMLSRYIISFAPRHLNKPQTTVRVPPVPHNVFLLFHHQPKVSNIFF